MRRGGQQVAIIGPDFVEAGLDRGNYVDRVAGAQRHGFRQSASQHFDLMQHMIADWDEEPCFRPDILQELRSEDGRNFRGYQAVTIVAMKGASQFRDAER